MRWIFVLGGAALLLSGCTRAWTEQIGENTYRTYYGDIGAEGHHAASVHGVMAGDKCPQGWDMLRQYQRPGQPAKLWIMEFSCVDVAPKGSVPPAR